MTLQELEQQIHQLSLSERLSLLNTITRSLQSELTQPQNHTQPNKRKLVEQLRGCLKQPGEPAPTDAEIDAMREQRLVEKYLAREFCSIPTLFLTSFSNATRSTQKALGFLMRSQKAKLKASSQHLAQPISSTSVDRQTQSIATARQILETTLELLATYPVTQTTLETAFNSGLSDFEDAVQIACAVAQNLDAIVTRNAKDFQTDLIPVLSIAALLQQIA